RVIQDRIKRPLAEELLFGKLTKGGVVKVDIVDGEPTFLFEEAPGKPAGGKPTGGGPGRKPDGRRSGKGGKGGGTTEIDDKVPELVE
ncbi:MAG: hypothetical protein WD100_02500, partial [Tistlia sp.]